MTPKPNKKPKPKKDGHCSFCCSHYDKAAGHICVKLNGLVIDPEPEWVRQFVELDGSIPSKTQKKYIEFVHSLLRQQLQQAREEAEFEIFKLQEETYRNEGRKEMLEEVAKWARERIKYIDESRSEGEKFGDPDYNFRNGWSSLESGPCCDYCRLDYTKPMGNMAALAGCKNPFQIPEQYGEKLCECHISFRKVAAKVEKNNFQDLLGWVEEKKV